MARKRAFVMAVTSGLTRSEAALTIGLSERQARRYADDPAIRAAIRVAQSEAMADLTIKLSAGARDTLDVITSVMHDSKQPGAVRIRACQLWLETAFRAREVLDVEERLTELERRLTDVQSTN